MAEDVEVMSVQEEEEGDEESGHMMMQANNSDDISSTNSSARPDHNTSSNGDAGVSDMVSSISDVYNGVESDGNGQACDCSSSSNYINTSNSQHNATVTQSRCSPSECDALASYQPGSACPSDTESEIVVDDSPSTVDNTEDRVVSSNDNRAATLNDNVEQECDIHNGSVGYLRPIRSRSVTPSPSFIRQPTPGTPRPSTRGTPGGRERAGSMGEIEMKERAQGRVRIIDGLDILQLPRPRNPGGILPLNGSDHFNSSNEALNLIIDNKEPTVKLCDNQLPVTQAFSNLHSFDTVTTTSSKQSNMSYMISNIIKASPNRQKPATISSFRSGSSSSRPQGCAINESVERPKPSSEVDSEGVAKKIARINSGGFLCSSTTESLWSSTRSNNMSSSNQLSSVRVMPDKTPPERPKPPRRIALSPADNGNIDLTSDRFVSSSAGRHVSTAISESLNRSQNTSMNGSDNGYDADGCPQPQHYKCRICNYSSLSYNLLQMHTSKHTGGNKMFRCSLCDYATVEKNNFRRHRRLHQKSSPVNMLKCVKCTFSTSLPRKLREHYQHVHPDMPASSLLPGLVSESGTTSASYLGSQGITPDITTGYHNHGQYYDNTPNINRSDRLGYPYSLSGRHQAMNVPFDQYNAPFSGFRDRQGENIASSYLRSIVTSIINSDTCPRQAAATSTVTSSNYFMPSGEDHSANIHDVHTCNGQASCPHTCNMTSHSGIKIKVETDIDNGSDASSCNPATPDIVHDIGSQADSATSTVIVATPSNVSRGISPNSVRRHRSEGAPANSHHRNDVPTDLSSPRKQRAISDTRPTTVQPFRINIDRIETQTQNTSITSVNDSTVSETMVKSDSTTRGIQCVLPLIKTEIDLDGDYYDFCRRPMFAGVDRAVQCNLNNSNVANNCSRSQAIGSSRMISRSQSGSESEHSEQPSLGTESRCDHCGISFEDEVIFSIHIGCHSHTDPFKCNVCGKQCGNKYGFYSHIMRGHQL